MKPHPPVTRLSLTKPPFACPKAAARCAGTMRPSQIHMRQVRLLCLILAAATICAPASAHERPATTPAARFLQDNLDKALALVRPPVSAKDSAELDIVIRDR